MREILANSLASQESGPMLLRCSTLTWRRKKWRCENGSEKLLHLQEVQCHQTAIRGGVGGASGFTEPVIAKLMSEMLSDRAGQLEARKTLQL